MQTKIIKVNPNFPEKDLIEEAVHVLQKGGLVTFPTETVYGIGADSSNPKAIDRLRTIKKRPKDKPFAIQIARFESLDDLGIVFSDEAEDIIHKFWPGPLTIVAFNRKKEKIGIRMPRNKIALEILSEMNAPLAVPSANISGKTPPISVDTIIAEMDGYVDMILDGGPAEIGIESTVLDVTTRPFTILREGAISKADLLATYHVFFVCTGNSCRSVMAKGMLEKFLKDAGLSEKVWVDSAGTGAYTGIPSAPNTIEVMKEEGVDVSSHKGKPVSVDLLKKSDFIYVMERSHRDIIVNLLPEIGSKVRLLKEGEDISDPIGRPIEEYRLVRGIIKDEVENIFLELFKMRT